MHNYHPVVDDRTALRLMEEWYEKQREMLLDPPSNDLEDFILYQQELHNDF